MKFDVTAGILAERDRLAEDVERLTAELASERMARATDKRRLREMLVADCEQAKAASISALRERAAGLIHAIGVLDYMGAALTPEPRHD